MSEAKGGRAQGKAKAPGNVGAAALKVIDAPEADGREKPAATAREDLVSWLDSLGRDVHDPERVRAGIDAAASAMAGEGLNLFEAMRACECLAEACGEIIRGRADALAGAEGETRA